MSARVKANNKLMLSASYPEQGPCYFVAKVIVVVVVVVVKSLWSCKQYMLKLFFFFFYRIKLFAFWWNIFQFSQLPFFFLSFFFFHSIGFHSKLYSQTNLQKLDRYLFGWEWIQTSTLLSCKLNWKLLSSLSNSIFFKSRGILPFGF